MVKDQNIKYLFEPRSIAVIGASNDKGKIGNAVISNIIKSGYKNKIFPINPKGGEIEGIKAYKSILDVPEEIDTACITIPAKFVLESIKECAAKGVKYAMVITSGFSEIGKIEEERKLVKLDFCRQCYSFRQSGHHYPERRFRSGHDWTSHRRQYRPFGNCFCGKQG
jgi:acyl-CoA synthetase (NDP forming)